MDKLAVYVDFDRTIAPIHGFTEPPKQEVVDALNLLRTKYKIIIYSTRANRNITSEAAYLELIDYLTKYNISYDEICESKPLFVAIIDDRSHNPLKESWTNITNELMSLS